MFGGGGSHITRRCSPDVKLEGINWADIDENGVRVTTQRISNINRAVTLEIESVYGVNTLYYRTDSSSSSFAANFDPEAQNSGWTKYSASPTNIVVKNNEWVSFGVPAANAPIPVDTTVTVTNITDNNTVADAFNLRFYVWVDSFP